MAKRTDTLSLLIEVVDKATGGIESIKRNLVGLAAAYLSFKGVQQVLNFAVEQAVAAAKAASEQEQANIALAESLASVGDSSKETLARFIQLGTELQRTTLYTDDQVQSATALLASLGRLSGDGLERAVRASADLAAGLKTDLESAAQMVAKAALGATGAFGRMGVKFDEGATKAENFKKVLDFISTATEGRAAAAADSFAGRIEQVGKQFGEVQEEIGKHIIASPEFKALLDGVATAFAQIAEKVKDPAFTQAMGSLTVTFARLGYEFASLIELSTIPLRPKSGLSATALEFLLPGNAAAQAGIRETKRIFGDLMKTVEEAHRRALSGEEVPKIASPDKIKPAVDEIEKLLDYEKQILELRRQEPELVQEEDLDRRVRLFGDITDAVRENLPNLDEALAITEKQSEVLSTIFGQWRDLKLSTLSVVEAQARLDYEVNFGLGTYQALQQAGADAGSTLVDAAFGAKVAWGAFFKRLLADITAAIVRMLIFKAIAGVASGGMGAFANFWVSTSSTAMMNAGGQIFSTGGRLLRAQGGMQVPGQRVNRDIVPALLTPGEVVVRTPVVEEIERRLGSKTSGGSGFMVNNYFNNVITRDTVEELVRKMNEYAEHMGLEVVATRVIA